MTESTTAEIRERHIEVCESTDRTFEDGEDAHNDRGILLDRLEAAYETLEKERQRRYKSMGDYEGWLTKAEQRIKELEDALRHIHLSSQSTMGGNSSDLGKIAREALIKGDGAVAASMSSS